MNHTDKPLTQKNQFYLYFPDDPWAAFNANACKTVTAPDVQTHHENVRRLQACWNLCLGVSTDQVEQTKILKDLIEDHQKMAKELGHAEKEAHDLRKELTGLHELGIRGGAVLPSAPPTAAQQEYTFRFGDVKPGERFIIVAGERTSFIFRRLWQTVSINTQKQNTVRECDGSLWNVSDNTLVTKIV